MNLNANQENFLFTNDNRNLLRYSYLVDEVTPRRDELYQTEQQNNGSIDVWSNFIGGFNLPIVNEENALLDLDRSFDSDIPNIEVESVESNLQPNPSTTNEVPQIEQENFFFIDNHHNLLRYFYLVDEVTPRLEEFHYTEQQNNESIDIWSDFIRGTDLSIVNEENFLLDLDCSFNSDIPLIQMSR
ncbi:14666_t:CDS:1 [Ambispora leptoticha]|uniref:14666_t:CDS:1 n=1 Tax=Ambispora leptoticha TaxID=144679 RepID=A0A9N9C518_9GLOM|nr:14666_t:CDS:1 [Ambispora leptoticha]